MHVSALLPFVIIATVGCFREAPTNEPADGPLSLTVVDAQGAVYGAEHTPRDPWLTLDFGGRLPPDAMQRLRLLPGIVSPALAARFASSRKSALDLRALPLAVRPTGGGLAVRPDAPLRGGERYTLVWLADLESASFLLTVGAEPSLGARLASSWPGDGQSHVPTQLARALLRFDGTLVGDVAGHVSLRRGDETVPTELRVERCSARGLPEGDCVWLAPRGALAPGAHQLALAPGLTAATGAPVPPSTLRFEVHAQDRTLLSLLPTRCGLDETAQHEVCTRWDGTALHVRGSTSDSALVSLLFAEADGLRTAATLSHANAFALVLTLPGLERPGSVLLRLTDLSGVSSERALHVLPEDTLASVSIDEVRADPLGKEPAQEYVELVNFGTTPVSLAGFRLTTSLHEPGRQIAPAVQLAPGERVLVVAPDFDAHDESDGALPSGTRLVRLEGALSLANGGLTLLLRDARGRRLSTAHVRTALVEGQCSARLAHDAGEERDALALDPEGGCTEGAPTLPTVSPPDP